MTKFVQKVASFYEVHVLKMPPLFPTLIQTNPLPPIFFCILAFAWGSVEMNPGFYLLGFYRFSLSVTDRKQTTFLMLLHWYPLDKCLVFFVLTSILNQIHLPMLSRSGSITGLSDHWQIWFTPWINNQPIDTAIKTEIWTFLRIRLIHKNIYGPALMVTASGSQKRERDKGREREREKKKSLPSFESTNVIGQGMVVCWVEPGHAFQSSCIPHHHPGWSRLSSRFWWRRALLILSFLLRLPDIMDKKNWIKPNWINNSTFLTLRIKENVIILAQELKFVPSDYIQKTILFFFQYVMVEILN